MMEIRNVYCVGRNYRLHAAELGNEVPSAPMLFLKPSHAVVSLAGGALELPRQLGEVHYEAELVFEAGRSYEPGMRVDELFSHMTVGLDLTLRGVQEVLKAKGQPWLAAKGFRNSAPVGEWVNFDGISALEAGEFGLRLNGREAQRGNVKEMVFSLQEIADFVGQAYGIGAGDVLFTGTPAGVGRLEDGDELELWWRDRTLARAKVAVSG